MNADYSSRRPCTHDGHSSDAYDDLGGSLLARVAVITLEETLAEFSRYLGTFESQAPPPTAPDYFSAMTRKENNYFVADSNLFRRTRKGAR